MHHNYCGNVASLLIFIPLCKNTADQIYQSEQFSLNKNLKIHLTFTDALPQHST